LPLNLTNHKWAEFRKTKAGVKLHLRLVFMERGLSYPDQAVITNAIKHDRGQLEVLIDDKSCMYVFDRGYLDYERFDRIDRRWLFLCFSSAKECSRTCSRNLFSANRI